MKFGVPFVAGSETSEEAAKSMEPSAGSYEGIVLDYIRSRGRHGATADECLVALNLTHQNGSARVSTLATKGLIVRTAHKRRTRSGRKAYVYIAANIDEPDPDCPTCGGAGFIRGLGRNWRCLDCT